MDILADHIRARETQQNIWLIENINDRMVNLLGQHFDIDPTFFMEYERTSKWRRWAYEPNMTSTLPSAARSYLIMKYYDLRDILQGIDSTYVSCADTGRFIYRTKWKQRWVEPSIVDRRCAFWHRTTEGEGWDVVVLCDPPLKRVHVWAPLTKKPDSKWDYAERKLLRGEQPFQGGYLDFVPRSHSPIKSQGPPRTSLGDDLCHYLINHSASSQRLHYELCLVILKKIVASHYMQLLNFTNAQIMTSTHPLIRRDTFHDYSIAWAQNRWSDIEEVTMRCSEYVESLESMMTQLKISFEDPKPSTNGGWQESVIDFQYCLYRAKVLLKQAGELNNTYSSLTGIVNAELSLVEARRSIREAKSMKILTIVAMIFIPLSFTCGLFSMAGTYAPGGKNFWIFWAVSTPLVILVFLGASVGQFGYDNEGRWSWMQLFRKMRASLS